MCLYAQTFCLSPNTIMARQRRNAYYYESRLVKCGCRDCAPRKKKQKKYTAVRHLRKFGPAVATTQQRMPLDRHYRVQPFNISVLRASPSPTTNSSASSVQGEPGPHGPPDGMYADAWPDYASEDYAGDELDFLEGEENYLGSERADLDEHEEQGEDGWRDIDDAAGEH